MWTMLIIFRERRLCFESTSWLLSCPDIIVMILVLCAPPPFSTFVEESSASLTFEDLTTRGMTFFCFLLCCLAAYAFDLESSSYKKCSWFCRWTTNLFVIQYSFRVSSMTQELCNRFIGPYPPFSSVFKRVDKTLNIILYTSMALCPPDAGLCFIFEWWPKVLPWRPKSSVSF